MCFFFHVHYKAVSLVFQGTQMYSYKFHIVRFIFEWKYYWRFFKFSTILAFFTFSSSSNMSMASRFLYDSLVVWGLKIFFYTTCIGRIFHLTPCFLPCVLKTRWSLWIPMTQNSVLYTWHWNRDLIHVLLLVLLYVSWVCKTIFTYVTHLQFFTFTTLWRSLLNGNGIGDS